MVAGGGSRIRWEQLPVRVQHGVEEILGSPVVDARSQPGGFSPGTADRLTTAAGGRAFVKAVSPAQNPDTPGIHRTEAAVCRQLPDDVPTARFLGLYDDGEWVALVLEDVEGRHPTTPWVADELEATLDALATLARRLTPSPVDGVPTATEAVAPLFGGWSRLVEDPPDGLGPWEATHLDELVVLSQAGVEAMAGDTLAHLDVRADNLLIRPDGEVVIVDWPQACTGPPWLDTLILLAHLNLHGGHDVDALAAHYAREASAAQIDGFLGGLAGFFLDAARRPSPIGLPTVRHFQRVQGVATLDWLRRRLGT